MTTVITRLVIKYSSSPRTYPATSGNLQELSKSIKDETPEFELLMLRQKVATSKPASTDLFHLLDQPTAYPNWTIFTTFSEEDAKKMSIKASTTMAPALSILYLSTENVISRNFSFELEIYLTFLCTLMVTSQKKSRKHTTKFSNKKTKIVK